jgi:hypothetical protein
MTKMEIAETNVTTGEFVQREMTADEIAKDAEHIAKIAIQETKMQAEKDKAIAAKAIILEKLGISELEAKLLLS